MLRRVGQAEAFELDVGTTPGGRTAGRGHRVGRARVAKLALVDGLAGAVWAPGGRPRVVFGFTISRGKIVEIELVADPERLDRLDLTIIDA